MADGYQKETVDAKHESMEKEIQEIKEMVHHLRQTTPHKDDVQEIQRTLTEDTNGRLKKLEGWRMYITGGLSVLCILVVPMLLYVVQQVI